MTPRELQAVRTRAPGGSVVRKTDRLRCGNGYCHD